MILQVLPNPLKWLSSPWGRRTVDSSIPKGGKRTPQNGGRDRAGMMLALHFFESTCLHFLYRIRRVDFGWCFLFFFRSLPILLNIWVMFVHVHDSKTLERWHVIWGRWLPKVVFFRISYFSWCWCIQHWSAGCKITPRDVFSIKDDRRFIFVVNITSWDPGCLDRQSGCERYIVTFWWFGFVDWLGNSE